MFQSKKYGYYYGHAIISYAVHYSSDNMLLTTFNLAVGMSSTLSLSAQQCATNQ